MSGNEIGHLEKMLKMNAYDGPGHRSTEKPMNFKFKIGDKAQHTAFGYNAIVMRRIYVEDEEVKYNCYDLGLWGSMPPVGGENIGEIYLKEGHRVE